ncbi:MAG: aldehyde ferredoxin oxidoreductase [Thermoprotei archaeon]|nr:MAG: aldehyde ferredoxin oxidoreductase [Thermoprotei archaeon]RLF18884.1 MAG: aldehyde ferredoxin oxidoreductase [Thermoprotei archaeon]
MRLQGLSIKGWRGRLLVVDLSQRLFKTVELSSRLLKAYIGGRGLGVKIVYDHTPRRVDAYHPDVPLIFAVGPLTATPFYSTARFCVISKSPLTGTLFDSSCGGELGLELKKAGFDALMVKGSSKSLVSLVIDDEDFLIKDAEGLRGYTTKATREALRKDYGEEFKVACIGPAGENMVRMASINSDEGHVAGRGGLGAVMGAKGLKALVVRGSKPLEVADEKGIRELNRLVLKRIKSNPITGKALPGLGTLFLLQVVNEHGMLPSRNFKNTSFDEAYKISAELFKAKLFKRRKGCFNCPIACKRVVNLKGEEHPQPEFETTWALGALCEVASPEALVELNSLCNDLGIDTISMGSTLACAMELSEEGLLDTRVTWGDVEAMKELIADTAHRRGLGRTLAEGSKKMAERLSRPELSMSVKGLELPAYDPRGAYGQALAYATSNRGGCHLRAYMISTELLGVPILLDRLNPIGKAELVAYYENFLAAIDSLIVCKFLSLELDDNIFASALRMATGGLFTRAELIKAGERIWNLERLFNLEEGFTSSHDTLPERILSSPGAPPLQAMLEKYYEVRGWNRAGKPIEAKLEELGLPGERITM